MDYTDQGKSNEVQISDRLPHFIIVIKKQVTFFKVTCQSICYFIISSFLKHLVSLSTAMSTCSFV